MTEGRPNPPANIRPAADRVPIVSAGSSRACLRRTAIRKSAIERANVDAISCKDFARPRCDRCGRSLQASARPRRCASSATAPSVSRLSASPPTPMRNTPWLRRVRRRAGCRRRRASSVSGPPPSMITEILARDFRGATFAPARGAIAATARIENSSGSSPASGSLRTYAVRGRDVKLGNARQNGAPTPRSTPAPECCRAR